MIRLWFILLFIFSSCLESERPVVETESVISDTLIISDDIDSLIILAEEAIARLHKKKRETQNAQLKLNKRLSDVAHLRNQYEDSIDDLSSLRLINRDSVIYDYRIEICEIVDSVRMIVYIPDSICPVCTRREEKSFLNVFKRKNKK